MHLSAAIAAGLAVMPLSLAAPMIGKRALSSQDISVLDLALYLEHLEYALYSGGYSSFTDAQYTAAGFPSGFRENVGVIAQQEQDHADTIAAVLTANGQTAFPPCTYSFPYSDPTSFVSLANMITSVGIGAYIGGGTELVDNTDLLTTASSILTVEARHDAYLRTGIGASPFPADFDTSLTALFSYSLAQQFIVSCPAESELPLVPLPSLTFDGPSPPIDLQPPVPAGTTLTFSWNPAEFFVTVAPSTPLYIAMVNQIAPPIFLELTITGTNTGTVQVPDGVQGAAFAILTTFQGGLDEMQLSQFGTLALTELVVS